MTKYPSPMERKLRRIRSRTTVDTVQLFILMVIFLNMGNLRLALLSYLMGIMNGLGNVIYTKAIVNSYQEDHE